jgi:hypothetical protein
MYDNDDSFLDRLEEFVSAGLSANEAVIVIATEDHAKALANRLACAGVDLDAARAAGQLISLDAEQMLRRFMVNGWPAKQQFISVMTELLGRATANGRTARAFGEMVALLWERQQYEATVRLEYLWDDFCARVSLQLLCAYPSAILETGPVALVEGIHHAHSQVFHH